MFFYIFHHVNQYLFNPKDVKDPIFNVRAIIAGGICYIVFHNYLNSIDSSYKQYFKWILLIDIIGLMVIYNSYYSQNLLQKIHLLLQPVQSTQNDTPKQSKNIKDTASYFNASIAESDEPSVYSKELEDIEEEEGEEEDESVQKLIDKMIGSDLKKKSN